jgi:hypothetical protein
MKAVELLEKYPEAAKVINEFYRSKIMTSMETDDVPDDFKEMLKQQSFDNEYIATFIDSSPRILFDVLDQNELHIEILVMYCDRPSIFTYTVVEGDLIHSEPTKYNSRIEAEKVAIEKAFEILNEKLCQIK